MKALLEKLLSWISPPRLPDALDSDGLRGTLHTHDRCMDRDASFFNPATWYGETAKNG